MRAKEPPYESGQKINKWTIISLEYKKGKGRIYLCRCECGTKREIQHHNLKTNKQCRACTDNEKLEKNKKEMIGKKFDKWLVLDFVGITKRSSFYLCECECGTKQKIRINSLKSGKTTKCRKCHFKDLHILKINDLTNKTIGNLYVIKYDGMRNGCAMWLCKCLKCNNIGRFIGKKISNSPSQKCRKCGTIGEMGGGVWAQILYGAKARNIPVIISIEEAYEIYKQQNGKCIFTGVEIPLGKNTMGML